MVSELSFSSAQHVGRSDQEQSAGHRSCTCRLQYVDPTFCSVARQPAPLWTATAKATGRCVPDDHFARSSKHWPRNMLQRRLSALQAVLLLTVCASGAHAESFAGPETDGTGQNCVKTTDSPTGPKCGSNKVGVCCDAFDKLENCLEAAGSSCASYGPHGDTPLTAFCCDQLDQPACNLVNTALDCPSQDVQVYPNGNQYLVCCAKVGPVSYGYHDGLDCRNATNTARLASCGAERSKLFCCS